VHQEIPGHRERKKSMALSLAELIIGLCLFALAIIPIFGIIPTAYMSIKKAEDYSAASCYAQEIVEIYRLTDPALHDQYTTSPWYHVKLNSTDYSVIVGLYGIDYGASDPCRVVDVVVSMKWQKVPDKISVFTRVFYND
jgi:hypothetical protein